MTTETAVRWNKGGRGFTLVEAMLAVVVLAIAAAGVLLPFVSGATVRAEGLRRTLAADLAANVMEQIVKTPFNDIISNYNYVESQGQVKDVTTGVPFTDPRYANFNRTVTSVAATVPPAECNFVLVTVQVNYSGRNMATLSRLVSE